MNTFSISPFWRAVFFLSGMIIGVGMYGIPYVISRAGFLIGLGELAVLSLVVLCIHLVYGEIVLRTRQWHRLPGYVRLYCGTGAEKISIGSYFISFGGVLGAYTLLGGEFLSNIFLGSADTWSFLFLFVGAGILFFGIRYHAKVDAITVSLLIALIVGIFIYALPHIKAENFYGGDSVNWFLPYGVIMFALAGMAAIPDMAGLLEHRPKMLRRAIIIGTLIPAFLYFLFTVAVVGVSGTRTTTEAMHGLAAVLGPGALFVGSVIGVLSTFGAFISLGSVFKSMLHLDIGFGWKTSWLVAMLFPLFFLLFQFKNYLTLIGFLGAVAIAVDGILMLLVYERAVLYGNRRSEYSLRVPPFVLAFLALVFISGLIYQILFY